MARASMMVEFLRTNGVLNRALSSLLDLGTGYGLQPMVMKGMGITDFASGIDVIKREGAVSPELIRKYHRRMKLVGPVLDKVYEKALRVPTYPINKAFNQALKKIKSPRYSLKNACIPGKTYACAS